LSAAADPDKSAIRAFVALDLHPMGVRRIGRVAERLRMSSGAPSATWTPPTKIHVTLKFIGQLPTSTVEPLQKAIGLDAFPSMREALVVVATLSDPKGELAHWARRLDDRAALLGIARETRAFRPHVTLARLKRAYDARRWLRPELAGGAGECIAATLTLYRSVVGLEVSAYEALARFAFASS
jgi:2'-5' RNA ligase